MADKETEAALVALLSALGDADDPAIADRAIDLYLNRLNDRERLDAVARLIRAMSVDDGARAAAARADIPAPSRRRQG